MESDFMKKFIKDQVKLGTGYLTVIDKPNICPCCHTVINAPIAAETNVNSEGNFAVLFICPSCNKYFFNSYTRDGASHSGVYTSKFFDSTPILNLDLDIPEGIENISLKFMEIYTQALSAEYYNLTEISGIALRKSIEFLIKDYLINFKKEDPTSIKSIMLGQAIKKIDNLTVQNLAKATTWIGNDETHYERRYEDKDVNDMKRFIRALVHFISFELIASEAEDFVTTP